EARVSDVDGPVLADRRRREEGLRALPAPDDLVARRPGVRAPARVLRVVLEHRPSRRGRAAACRATDARVRADLLPLLEAAAEVRGARRRDAAADDRRAG